MAENNNQTEATVVEKSTTDSKKKSKLLNRLQERKAARQAKKANKQPKVKKEKKPRRPFKVVMKTWSKGLGKEVSRVEWEKKNNVAKDFVTILVIAVILALIFFAIDLIILSVR